jgi:dTDP-glucose 4,6-dehydratase
MKQTVLVTGGAGFIGSAVVRALLARGISVVNLDALTYAANLEDTKINTPGAAHEFVHGSINDEVLVSSLLNKNAPTAIINVAAETHVDRSIDGPQAFVDTNIQGTFQLLECARRYLQTTDDSQLSRFKFLQVSTDEVFGSVADGLSREDDPYRPNSPYAASKAAADHLVRSYFKTYGLATLTTHGSNTYGPGQFPEKLIPLMILNAIDGKQLPVYGDGANVRDWLFVDDHAAGIVAALVNGTPGENFNIGGGTERRNIDTVKGLCVLLDETLPREGGTSYVQQIAYVADRPGHDQRYALDCTKAADALGWKPEVGFDTGLRTTVEWYLAHQDWCRSITQSTYDRHRLGLDGAGEQSA